MCLVLVLASVSGAGGNENRNKAATASTPTRITYWSPLSPTFAQVVQEFSQTEYAKQLAKNTNTEIIWTSAPGATSAQTNEAFNILVASGNYPDIIEYQWNTYPGGPGAAIADNVIVELTDVYAKYAPNYSKILNENPEVKRITSTADGKFYTFPFLRGYSHDNNKRLFSEGLQIRKDLLDKIGLDIPATPDEWYKVLTAFKNQLGMPTPFTTTLGYVTRAISPGFDSIEEFYVDNGKVLHGAIQPERRRYLAEVHKWYAEELLDNDYFAVDRSVQQSKLINNLAGATYGTGGSGLGQWLPALKQIDPNASLVPVAPMSPVKGRKAKLSNISLIYSGGYSASISTSCKNIEAATRLLDYNYGEEGYRLANFGIEGVTYNMINGYPTYTDFVLKNADGLSITQVMSKYIRGHVHGPFVQAEEEIEQYYTLPEQKLALDLWKQTDMGQHFLPPLSPTASEASELARIMNNVNTYRDEMEAKFITGATNISEFDNYVAQQKKFGIDRAIEIQQKAYDQYLKK